MKKNKLQSIQNVNICVTTVHTFAHIYIEECIRYRYYWLPLKSGTRLAG